MCGYGFQAQWSSCDHSVEGIRPLSTPSLFAYCESWSGDVICGDCTAEQYAQGIGNLWGVGDAEREDGVVVLVDLKSRNTWVEYSNGLKDFPSDPGDIAALGNTGFRSGEFNAGIRAILAGLEDGFQARVR